MAREVDEGVRAGLLLGQKKRTDYETEELADVARVIKHKKMYEQTFTKLMVVIVDNEAAALIKLALKAIGAKLLTGQAPAGNLERQVSKLVEAWSSDDCQFF